MKLQFRGVGFLSIIALLASCTKGDVNSRTDDGPPPASDSVSLLTLTGGGQFSYSNDTLPDKLFTVNSSPYTGSFYEDTTFIYYNAERKPNRLLTVAKTGFPFPDHYKTYHFAVYESGHIVKIFTKRTVYDWESEYYDPAYALSIGPLVPYNNIQAYDSIIYDNRGRVIKKYHFNAEDVPGLGYVFKLGNYDALDYHNPVTGSDDYLYSVKRDMYVASHYEIYFKDYDTAAVNPLYKTFKELALFQGVLHIRKFYPAQYVVDGEADRYITLNPHPLKKLYGATVGGGLVWQDFLFSNAYDINSNLLSGSYSSIYTSGWILGYNYLRRKR